MLQYRIRFIAAALAVLALVASCNRTAALYTYTVPMQPQTQSVSYTSGAVDILIVFDVKNTAHADEFRLVAVLPQDVPGRQRIESIGYSHQPTRVFSQGGQRYAEWRLSQPAATMQIRLDVRAVLEDYSLARAQNTPPQLDPRARQYYLQAEPWLEADSPALIQTAQAIPNQPTTTGTARAVMTYVKRRLHSAGYRPGNFGAAQTLREGVGDCTDYTDLFVTLCRAKGIPARCVEGYYTKAADIPSHSWAEFWDESRGWVPVDPLHIDHGSTTFGVMQPRYLYCSFIRNDTALEMGTLYRWWAIGGGDVKVVQWMHIYPGARSSAQATPSAGEPAS